MSRLGNTKIIACISADKKRGDQEDELIKLLFQPSSNIMLVLESSGISMSMGR